MQIEGTLTYEMFSCPHNLEAFEVRFAGNNGTYGLSCSGVCLSEKEYAVCCDCPNFYSTLFKMLEKQKAKPNL